MALPEEIESRLAVLVGKPLWSVSRACDLEGLSFGDRWLMSETGGRRARQTREIAEYALHVMCGWRFRTSVEMLVASRNVYAIVDGGETWDRIGANRRDVRMNELIRPRLPTVVRAVKVHPVGGFSIEFNGDLVFEVFSDDTGDDEHWRFFQPYQSTPHFVFEKSELRTE